MSKRHNRAKATGGVGDTELHRRVLGGLPGDHPGGVLPAYHQVAKSLSEGHKTVEAIQRATGLHADVIAEKLHEMHSTGSAVQDGDAWKLGEMVQMPVHADVAPKLKKWLDRQPAVSEGTLSIPREVAGSATELAGKPDVLRGIVKKLMEGVKGEYRNDKDFVDDCVQAFLNCSASAMEQARGGARGFDGMHDEAATQNARRISMALSRARLFCVRPERFLICNQIADRFTTEKLAGQSWRPFDGRDESTKDTEGLVDAYYMHGTSWPFPDPLPFDSMFICYGRRMNLREAGLSVWGRLSPDMSEHFGEPDVFLYGHLLWVEGDVPEAFACIGIQTHRPTESAGVPKLFPPGFIQAYGVHDGESQWAQPMSLDPWILNMLVKSINEHKSVNEAWTQTLSQRMDRKKKVGGVKTVLPLPEPFYLVPLKDELIEPPEYRSNAAVPKMVEWSHRWDVRGHEVVRVLRGKLPLSLEDAEKLKKRGYRVYAEGRITDPEDSGRVLKRGVRGPGLGEWMAVLSYWRDAFVKGPTDKPYVPGARV